MGAGLNLGRFVKNDVRHGNCSGASCQCFGRWIAPWNEPQTPGQQRPQQCHPSDLTALQNKIPSFRRDF